MLTKTMIALSAMALLGSVSVASAYEASEHKIGDRFAHLEKTYAPVATKSTGNRMTVRQAASRGLIVAEAPEHKLGDRFAFLDAGYAPIAVKNTARVMMVRTVQTQMGYETPENKIGDRYPLLDRGYAFRGGAGHSKKV